MAASISAQREQNSGAMLYWRRQLELSTVDEVIQGRLEIWLAGCRDTSVNFVGRSG